MLYISFHQFLPAIHFYAYLQLRILEKLVKKAVQR